MAKLFPLQTVTEIDRGGCMRYEAIIVGGGMAGLTAAAYLVRAGKRVLLCEKEQEVGGLVASFERGGFTFDAGIRAMESSGIVHPMLRQLGIAIDFLPSSVSIGIGRDVMKVTSRESLQDYERLLARHFPSDAADIARIVAEVRTVMGYLDVLYGIDNPFFLDLTKDPKYLVKTILPWMVRYALTMPKIGRLMLPFGGTSSGWVGRARCGTWSISTSSRRPLPTSR